MSKVDQRHFVPRSRTSGKNVRPVLPLTRFPSPTRTAKAPGGACVRISSFFSGDENTVRASIVDPHGHHLGEAFPKLRGLAEFAAAFGDEFHRIEAIAEMNDGVLRVLDMRSADVCKAIGDASDAENLYRSGRNKLRIGMVTAAAHL